MIENGATKPCDDIKKVPVSEVKPIKKDSKKHEDRNTLEVGSSDYRRHKSNDHKKEKISDKHVSKTETSKAKDDHKHKTRTDKEAKVKESDARKEVKDEKEKPLKRKEAKDEEPKEEKDSTKSSETKKSKDNLKSKEHHKKETKDDKIDSKVKESPYKKERDPSKLEKAKSKTDLEQPSKSSDKPTEETSKEGKTLQKRTTSSEKKLVKSAAVCDEMDGDIKEKKLASDKKYRGKLKDKDGEGVFSDTNGHLFQSNGALFTKYKGVKPPNILVYADSHIAKDNVKSVLSTMLNKEKYV